tara:strand:- start:1286 stop:1816 length:531 start_codon:yes stop_codon:yes gene_type:complete
MKWWVFLLLPFQVFAQDTIYNNCEELVKTYYVEYSTEKYYNWRVEGGTIISGSENVITVQWPHIAGQYKIIAWTNSGNDACYGDTSEYIVSIVGCPVIYIPNAFTPNNDGNNDIYEIKGALSNSIKYMAIYDRWGKQIVESNSNILWDGNNYPSGVYSIIVLVENEKHIKNITLIR